MARPRTPEMDAWMDRNGGPLAGGPAPTAGQVGAGTLTHGMAPGTGQGAASQDGILALGAPRSPPALGGPRGAQAANGAGTGEGGDPARDAQDAPPQSRDVPNLEGAASPDPVKPQPAPPVEQAKTLAKLLGISPSWQPGQEAAAVAVLGRLKGLRNLALPAERNGFPGFLVEQGFAAGSPFNRECMDRFLGAHDGIGSAQGVDPKLPDPGVSDDVIGRMVTALERSPKYAGEEVASALTALATKENAQVFLLVTIAFMTLQVTPAGWAADALLVIAVGTTLAMSLSELKAILEDVVGAVRLVRSKDGDLDEAAKLIARVASKLTVDVFVAIVLHKANKAATSPPQGGSGVGGLQAARAGGGRLPAGRTAAGDASAATGPSGQFVPPFVASMAGDPPGGGPAQDQGSGRQPAGGTPDPAAGPNAAGEGGRAPAGPDEGTGRAAPPATPPSDSTREGTQDRAPPEAGPGQDRHPPDDPNDPRTQRKLARKAAKDAATAAMDQEWARSVAGDPMHFANKTPQDIAAEFASRGFRPTVRQGTKGSGRATFVDIANCDIGQVAVHPGGGRHRGPYTSVKTNAGVTKLVDPATYMRWGTDLEGGRFLDARTGAPLIETDFPVNPDSMGRGGGPP